MSKWADPKKKNTPLPAPDPQSVIHEAPYRGYRIVCTDDPALIGTEYKDKWGFTPGRGYVVLDDFDEVQFPIGMHWFHTPDDAACAIEMLDTILPALHPNTTLLYEYTVMRQYRREFWNTYNAIVAVQKMCDDALAFDDNPREQIVQRLHLLRQQAAQPSKGFS